MRKLPLREEGGTFSGMYDNKQTPEILLIPPLWHQPELLHSRTQSLDCVRPREEHMEYLRERENVKLLNKLDVLRNGDDPWLGCCILTPRCYPNADAGDYPPTEHTHLYQ